MKTKITDEENYETNIQKKGNQQNYKLNQLNNLNK